MNLNEYVGIPYAPGGRSRPALDCYGLLRLALMEMFYVELPEMATGPVSPRGLSRALTAGTVDLQISGNLVAVNPENAPHKPLIAVTWHDGIATHCGLLLGLRLLHTSAMLGESVCQRFTHYRARSGPVECYLWQP